MPGALDGVRILDFTRYQQGPFATVLLSDLGADVIKVEEPTHGDLGRSLGLQPDGWCSYFQALNRNKRSLTVDTRTEAGREIVYRLIPETDVVTDNFRPGTMKRFGLDHESLAAINPRIITASASGFGPKGPFAHEPSFDSIGQAMGGHMVAQGGGPDAEPAVVIGGMADQVGAMIFALGICAAIAARELHGVGQHVDTSLLGSQLALQGLGLTGFLRQGEQRSGGTRWNPLFTYYPCADGLYLSLGLLDPKWWPAFCEALERDDLMVDERFAQPAGRIGNREALIEELNLTFARKPRDEWLTLLKAANLPCGPVNDYAAVAKEPQVIANEYITTLQDANLGEVGVVGSPIDMSVTVSGPRSTAPDLGQHTEEILLEFGYTWDDIERFKESSVI